MSRHLCLLVMMLLSIQTQAVTIDDLCPYGATGTMLYPRNLTKAECEQRHASYQSMVKTDCHITVEKKDWWGFASISTTACRNQPSDDTHEFGCLANDTQCGQDNQICYDTSGNAYELRSHKTCSDYCVGPEGDPVWDASGILTGFTPVSGPTGTAAIHPCRGAFETPLTDSSPQPDRDIGSGTDDHDANNNPVTVGGTDNDDGQTDGSESDSSDNADDSNGQQDNDDGALSTVTDFFEEVLGFIRKGIYDWADTVLERITAWYIIWNIELKLMFLEIAVNIADSIVKAFNISGKIEQYLGAIDSKLLAFVVWLRIPEALSMMLSAHIVRFILQLF